LFLAIDLLTRNYLQGWLIGLDLNKSMLVGAVQPKLLLHAEFVTFREQVQAMRVFQRRCTSQRRLRIPMLASAPASEAVVVCSSPV